MSYKDNPPKTMDELKALSFDERVKLWAKYSQYPFKRQMRSLWYYIQCDRLNLRIEHKYLVQIRNKDITLVLILTRHKILNCPQIVA